MADATVSEEGAVAQHLPRVARLARRFNGLEGAEYDDLYQEGSIAVLLALREDRRPSDRDIKSAMLMWTRRCARWRRQEPMSEAMMDESGIHSDPGRRKEHWTDSQDTPQGGWSESFYVPK